MTKITSLIVVMLMIFSTAGLLARPGNRHRGDGEDSKHHKRMYFGNIEKMKKKLELKDNQIDKISKINRKFKKKLLKHKEVLAPKRIRLKGLLLEEDINLNKVRSLLREISDVKIELRLLRIKHRIEIEKILTPDQKRKHRANRKRMRKKHHRHGR